MNFENNLLQDSSISDSIAFAEKYGDAITREYEINQLEAQLLLLESAIDMDTYVYMVSENSRVFCEKMEKKATSLSEKMMQSMQKLKTKLFGNGTSKETLTKFEKFKKFLNMNPDIGNKKVKFSDRRKDLDAIHEQRRGLLQLAAKQKATKKFDKEPLIKYGKKWEAYKQQQKTKELKKDVTLAVACGIGFDLLNRAEAWLNNENMKEIQKYNEIVNPPPELSDNLKATYCCMRDIVNVQFNTLNSEEQAILVSTVDELNSLYNEFAPEFEAQGKNYQQIFANNAANGGWT